MSGCWPILGKSLIITFEQKKKKNSTSGNCKTPCPSVKMNFMSTEKQSCLTKVISDRKLYQTDGPWMTVQSHIATQVGWGYAFPPALPSCDLPKNPYGSIKGLTEIWNYGEFFDCDLTQKNKFSRVKFCFLGFPELKKKP